MTKITLTCSKCRQQFRVDITDTISYDPKKMCPDCKRGHHG
jgi:DNA replicative helicase MCM subunit Mcm2 (Cdc46/Mcm family)